MGFGSILDLKDPVKGMTRPIFFQDLNIDQIIEKIVKGDRRLGDFFEYFPLDAECEQYRRLIYRDIKNNGLADSLRAFCDAYRQLRENEEKKKGTRIQLQKPIWHFFGISIYANALKGLRAALAESKLDSSGFRELLMYLNEYLADPKFIKMSEIAEELKTALERLRVTAIYKNGRISVYIDEKGSAENKAPEDEGTEIEKASRESGYEDDEDEEDQYAVYEEFLRYFMTDNEKTFVNPFASVSELTSFEQEIAKIVTKKDPELFKKAEKLYSDYAVYEEKSFSRLADELPFYLSFFEFQTGMEKKGFRFSEPRVNENERISANGLYDLALACVNSEKDKPVISNDFYFDENDLFFVLTGPNQGGKTTFARSLGQLVYFTKMGFDVAAEDTNLHYFKDILTHFSVEESVETGRGKLMEELVRLSPMMKNRQTDSFIVINELFTTAANYDAIIMGKNVLSHFINEGCHGIYVTHLRELCDVDKRVVGLSAQLDENGIQNFKILRKDVKYEACAENQINKYRLSYKQLKERLGI